MIKAVTGTKDILPSDNAEWHFLEKKIREIFTYYNYSEIRTPLFEETSLFARSIGETTDIVGKEMYTFTDRSGTSLTLKPEMTAAVVRAYIEHSLGKQQNINKLYYISPMFRQERPQAGRQRQFHQFGAEAIGSSSPLLDAEMIQMAFEILRSLGLKDLQVRINSLGGPRERDKYKQLLKEFLLPHQKHLSDESRKRLDTNILRIFDSKAEQDQKIMETAPMLIHHLDKESLDSFELVKKLLDKSSIPYVVDPALVRGLDYYTNTTFEILSGKVGSQSALCGGGRYDLLVEQLGGEPSPGVGFAAGMERILLACRNEKALDIPAAGIGLYIVSLNKNLASELYQAAGYFRNNGIKCDFDYLERSVKAQMREANRQNAKFVLFFGGDEYNEGNVLLKNMQSGSQELVPLNTLSRITEAVKNG